MDANVGYNNLYLPKKMSGFMLNQHVEQIVLPSTATLNSKSPNGQSLFIAAGKDKVKVKLILWFFLSNKGQLHQEDIGPIEVKDFFLLLL